MLVATLSTSPASPWSERNTQVAKFGEGRLFIEAAAGRLVAGGTRWTPVGYNDYRLTSTNGGYVCDPTHGAISDDELAARLDRVRKSGGNTVRTWFFQSYWDPDGDGSGSWGSFDRVLAAASQRDIRVIGVLANHWADCEGGAPRKDRHFYEEGYREPTGDGLPYLDYARMVAKRYAESPAVAYWQLINEPEAPAGGSCAENAAARALREFAATATAAIHAADRNHLVSLGTTGGRQCGTAGPNYERVHRAVDVCELHVYGNPKTRLKRLDARIAACEDAGKPIVAGEVGLAADVDGLGRRTGLVTSTTLAHRARLIKERLTATSALGLDGFLLWRLAEHSAVAADADPYAIGPGDPLEAVLRDLQFPGTADDPERPSRGLRSRARDSARGRAGGSASGRTRGPSVTEPPPTEILGRMPQERLTGAEAGAPR